VRTDPRSLTRNGRCGSWRAVPAEDEGGRDSGVDIVDRVWSLDVPEARLRKSEEQWSVASGQWSVIRTSYGLLDTGPLIDC
jgi:hypothetical protein